MVTVTFLTALILGTFGSQLLPGSHKQFEPYVSIENYDSTKDFSDLYRIFNQNTNNLGSWYYGDSHDLPGTNLIKVARIDEKLAGFVIYRTLDDDNSAFINHVAVDRDVRSHGLGTLLLDEAINDLKSKGVASVGLSVFAHNTKAQSLYERMGFKKATNSSDIEDDCDSLFNYGKCFA